MRIQRAQYLADGNISATVDGRFAVIPANPGNRHFDAIVAGGIPVAPYAAPPASVPQQMTFAQLLIGLVAEGWITEAEGDAWLEGRIPAAARTLIGTLPQGQRFAAKARAARPSIVLRNDPLVTALATAQGRADDLDRFFTTYAAV
jgi:hypothetical protein